MFKVSLQFDDQDQFLAAYFDLSEKPIARTLEIAPECHIDLDAQDNVVGAELLAPGELRIIRDIARKYRLPALEKISQTLEPTLAATA